MSFCFSRFRLLFFFFLWGEVSLLSLFGEEKNPPKNPFGILGNREPPNSPIKLFQKEDPSAILGIHWVRLNLPWGRQQKERGGNFHWLLEDVIEKYRQLGMRVFLTVLPKAPFLPELDGLEGKVFPQSAEDLQEVKRWAEAMASHYKNKGIVAYEFGNEIDLHFKHHVTPKMYAEAFSAFYQGIKKGDPDALVLPYGMHIGSRLMENYWPVIRKMGLIPDGWDQHYHLPASCNYLLVPLLQKIKRALPHPEKTTLFVTECSTFTGTITSGMHVGVSQTEEQQAISLIQRCCLGAAENAYIVCGIPYDRLLWKKGDTEGKHKFSLNGVIHNPDKNYGTQENTLTRDWPKLVFWSMKKLCALCQGTDPKKDFQLMKGQNIRKISQRAEENIVVVKVDGFRKDIYVVWRYTPESKPDGQLVPYTLTIEEGASKNVEIMRALPQCKTGKGIHLENWEEMFPIEKREMQEGKVMLHLDESPVYVILHKEK